MNNFYNHKVNRNNVQMYGMKVYQHSPNNTISGSNSTSQERGLPSNTPHKPRHQDYFGMRVRGNSMLPPNI